jgi:predicted metalloendopeptidase
VIPALLDLQLHRHKQFNCKRTGINVNYMDKTVKPANPIYVNGTWLDNTEIPSDRTRWEVLMN